MSALGPGRVAVVTGAASGIGFGLSQRFAAEGMHVVMADVEEAALAESAAKIDGAVPVVTDVSDERQVDALRDRALAEFGAVHVLANNAGVGGSHAPMWRISRGEWEWVLGVNLWGVINGVRSFVPVLLEQDAAHIVNTASIFGVFAGSLGAYSVSKHAVVALSESLYFQLADTPVGVSVLCPGAVATRFGTSDRNRPASAPAAEQQDRDFAEHMNKLLPLGRPPAEVADLVAQGISSSRFYILTSENRNEAVVRRAEGILAGGPPAPPMPPR
jgi:NAD(P)-dependent dehydrogenase (short-subunit alcohol dehydrogenase family)